MAAQQPDSEPNTDGLVIVELDDGSVVLGFDAALPKSTMQDEAAIREWQKELQAEWDDVPVSVNQAIGLDAAIKTLAWVLGENK